MLTATEKDDVTDLLASVISMSPSPRQSLAAFLDSTLAARLGEGEPRVLVETALQLCIADGFRSRPASIVRLLSGLLPGQPEVAVIVERLNITPPTMNDPFDALILRSNLPFLDRQPTRHAVKAFLDLRPNKPVIVVNGQRRAGKTYTTEFVDHVLQDRPDTSHCLVRVREHQGASVGPVELARDMVTNMGGDPASAPPMDTNQELWTKQIANWVLSVANNSPNKWWFILDGFNASEMREDTKQVIVKLASSLETGLQRDRHRLILIDFDRTVLSISPGKVSDQTTSPIPHTSVQAAVTHILSAAPPDLDSAAITADVLDGLPDPVTDLPELGSRLCSLIATFEEAS